VVVVVGIVYESQSGGGSTFSVHGAAFSRCCPASDVVDVTVVEKGDVMNGLHSAFVFLGQRRGWRRNTGGLFWFPKTWVEEKRRECDVRNECLAE